jgi:hypothetical protein
MENKVTDVAHKNPCLDQHKSDRLRAAFAMACISIIVAIDLVISLPNYQPISPFVPAGFGVAGAVGIGLGMSAFRFGGWGAKLIALFAICINSLIVISVSTELYSLW